ncbi:hypothetical protein OL229_16235 [Neisseriaceae bacterium JH1-16]|nr:hypothetical protein [Neisseriaceae bacterium JH1-16]
MHTRLLFDLPPTNHPDVLAGDGQRWLIVDGTDGPTLLLSIQNGADLMARLSRFDGQLAQLDGPVAFQRAWLHAEHHLQWQFANYLINQRHLDLQELQQVVRFEQQRRKLFAYALGTR